MREVFSELIAISNSKSFTPFAEGIRIDLSGGEQLVVKTKKTFSSPRPIGLRFSKYSFITEMQAGDHIGFGYGEAPTQLLALQKSIAEGVERAIYHAMKGSPLGTLNSNGWAAHLTPEHAFATSLEELIERDAVLVHWLSQRPMQEIPHDHWPKWLSQWARNELTLSPIFNRLRILVSSEGYLPTVTTVLMSPNGNGVASHATAKTLEQAVSKALAEACRIAQIAMESPLQKNFTGNTFSILEHINFYAFNEKLPDWLFGDHQSWSETEKHWKKARREFKSAKLNAKFHQIVSGALTVGYATCDCLQGLFFGHTKDAERSGLINFDRLKSVGVEGVINLQPHLVA